MGFSLAVRELGREPVTCNARTQLFLAHAALERGEPVVAGCQMREAARLYLLAECKYWDCSPKKPNRAPIHVLLCALRKGKPEFGWDWVQEVVSYGNKLAHCQFVRRGLIETSLEIMHLCLDEARYLIQPVAAGRLA